MDTVEITHILSNDVHTGKCFLGVFPSNHVPLGKTKLPCCFILNTDPSWKSGSHWLAIYVDHKGNAEFFDSYGQLPSKYPAVQAFLRKYDDTCKFSTRQLQSTLSSTCGQFCLYFLLWRCRGVSFDCILRSFDHLQENNDLLVTTFINTVFDRNTTVYDVDFVINQCCKSLCSVYTTHF